MFFRLGLIVDNDFKPFAISLPLIHRNVANFKFIIISSGRTLGTATSAARETQSCPRRSHTRAPQVEGGLARARPRASGAIDGAEKVEEARGHGFGRESALVGAA